MTVLNTLSGLGWLEDARDRARNPSDDSLTGGAVRNACRAWSRNPVAGALAGGGSPGVADAFGRGMNYLCEPASRQGGYDLPVRQPGFAGGQCEAVPYNIRFFINNPLAGTPYSEVTRVFSVGTYPFYGPIRGIRLNGVTLGVDCNTAAGAPSFVSLGASIAANALDAGATYGIVWVQRSDSQPDVCGDAPPRWVTQGTPSPTINFGDTNNVNLGGVQVPITIGAPSVNFNGDVSIRVGSPIGDFEFAPSIDARPTVAPETPPPVEGTPVDVPSGGGDVDAPEEEEETGRELVGYRWEFVNAPLSRGWIANSSPRVSPRVFGNIRLKYEGAGGLFWGTNLEIDSVQGFISRPLDGLKVKGVALQSEGSYNQCKLFPVYVIRTGYNNGR